MGDGTLSAWITRNGLTFAPVVLLLAIWEIAARILNDPLSLPTLGAVLTKWWEMLSSGELIPHILVSTGRSLAGFAVAAVLGIAIGLAMGRSQMLERSLNPLISFTYPVPKIGLLPLFILWFGLGEQMKVIVIFTAAIYPVIINTFTGIRGVPRVLVWRARTFGASTREILFRVVLPAALPHILSGLRLAMGISWIVLFAAEMVAAPTGLGFLILYSEQIFQTDVVFVALLTIALLGFLFDRFILLISHRLCDWYFRQAGEEGA
jgi:ABC-type nitrate/sulfonate/bicarbonate transport system permease component